MTTAPRLAFGNHENCPHLNGHGGRFNLRRLRLTVADSDEALGGGEHAKLPALNPNMPYGRQPSITNRIGLLSLPEL
jgi:hypothetical protein